MGGRSAASKPLGYVAALMLAVALGARVQAAAGEVSLPPLAGTATATSIVAGDLAAGTMPGSGVGGGQAGIAAAPNPPGSPPTRTPTATATPTPTGTATPTATATASPTATSAGATATVTSTATATATASPTGQPSGNTRLAPSGAQSANPGTALSYTHTVTNTANPFDYKNIAASSSEGWTLGLFQADGTTPLVDTNADGAPDTGRLSAGQSVDIVVKVTVPAAALGGVQDVTTVTASSGRNPIPANTATVTDITTVNGVISLTISAVTRTFGQVSPDGQVDSLVSGVSSAVDAAGAYYVDNGDTGEGAFRVTVDSNGPWAGACWAEENAGGTTMAIAGGDLAWRLAGTADWTTFTTTAGTPPYDNSCFDSNGVGSNSFSYALRLRVDWTDSPGTFTSTLTYAASQ